MTKNVAGEKQKEKKDSGGERQKKKESTGMRFARLLQGSSLSRRIQCVKR